MSHAVRILAALLALLVCQDARAQCQPVPNTGCGKGGVGCSGTSGIGQSIGVLCSVGGGWYLLLGLCLAQPIVVREPIVCGTCNLGIDPSVAYLIGSFHGGTSLSIPMDPRLIGATLCMQCIPFPQPCPSVGCPNTPGWCFPGFSDAVRFTITP